MSAYGRLQGQMPSIRLRGVENAAPANSCLPL